MPGTSAGVTPSAVIVTVGGAHLAAVRASDRRPDDAGRHDWLVLLRTETPFDRGVRGVSRALIGFMVCCAPLVFVVNDAVH